jgi:protein involved in polysaccharide export with SLBB domain
MNRTLYANLKLRCLFMLICLFAASGFDVARAQIFSPVGCHEIVVMGAVKTPGRLNVQGRMRLNQVLTQAGGSSARAGKAVSVFHFCNCGPCSEAQKTAEGIDYDLSALHGQESANPYVEAGDIVIVPETNVVFVAGNLLKQRSLDYVQGMTLTRAIALAEAVTNNSNQTRVRIHRTVVTGQAAETFVFDLKAIVQGQIEDPLLQPLDFLEVSDEQGRFPLDGPRRLNWPTWDPPLLPRKSPNC